MVAFARKDIVPDDEVGLFHCWSRCVRRSFLYGKDPVSGKDLSHRRGWVRQRLENLAACFSVEVAGEAIMENHIHAILRTRPDLASQWSDEEVARRWLRLSSQKIELRDVDEQRLQATLADPQKIAEYRGRLSSLSWFMRYLNEPIARMANAEDDCRGRFFEERFRCQHLLDESALLACSIYVDLNPVRANVALTPEASTFTSAADRIADRRSDPSGASGLPRSGWRCPIPLSGDAYQGAAAGRRASDKGLFEFGLDQYLELLDWTGRQIRADKRGAIPSHLTPILERLEFRESSLIDTITQFGRRFHRAVGRPASMAAAAASYAVGWLHGSRASRAAFI